MSKIVNVVGRERSGRIINECTFQLTGLLRQIRCGVGYSSGSRSVRAVPFDQPVHHQQDEGLARRVANPHRRLHEVSILPTFYVQLLSQ